MRAKATACSLSTQASTSIWPNPSSREYWCQPSPLSRRSIRIPRVKLTYLPAWRKMVKNRVWLTLFSAPPELPGSPEVNSINAGAEEMLTRRVVFPIKVSSSAGLTRIVGVELDLDLLPRHQIKIKL